MINEKFDMFNKTWAEEISKIENKPLDFKSIRAIRSSFDKDTALLSEEKGDFFTELQLLDSRLTCAIGSARTKYVMQLIQITAWIIVGIASSAFIAIKYLM